MIKKNLLAFLLICSVLPSFAQEEEEERRGFKKENLFSGGSIALSFFSGTFLVGGNPVLGYRVANWLDGGIVGNIQYMVIRDYGGIFDSRLKQFIYGGGLFTRIYPINFLFATAQLEHNFIEIKFINPDGSSNPGDRYNTSANSVLVGAGYATGRAKEGNSPFFYFSIMWDISGNENSPYTDGYGRSVPIIRAGFNIPLFQGGGGGGY